MKKQRLASIILITLLGFICYFNALGSGFIWDDTALIKENFLIRDSRHIGKLFVTDLFNRKSEGSSFYRPIQSLSYMLDYHIYKLNPQGFHLTNIILQILVAILVYELILIISQNTTISLISALLFVVHPIHVEAVTYLSGRADMLLGLFLLLSLILFIRSFYLLSLISFICALFSKELSLVFPFLLLLYIFVYNLKLAKKPPPNIFVYLSFLLISAIYIYLNFKMFPGRAVFPSLEAFYRDSLFSVKAPFLYLKTLLLPIDLHMARTVNLPISIFEPQVLLSIIGLIFIFFIMVKTYRSSDKSRLFSFGLAWFFLFLLPYLGIFKINAYFAEHFCYLSSIGVFFILALAFTWLIKKKKIFVVFPSFLIIAYSLLTIQYNLQWRNPERFYRRIIKLSKNSFSAYNNLAAIEEKKENYQAAEKYYLKALNIKPDFDRALINLLRVIYLGGREEAAIAQIKDFLKKHPDSLWAWANLGSMYEAQGEYAKAIEAYKQSLNINPHMPKHHYFLGLTFQEAGDLDSAIKELVQAIRLDSRNYAYHNDLGLIYKNKGLFGLAVREYLAALRLVPESPEVNLNLGVVYSLMGNFDMAEYYFLNSIKLDSNSALSHYNLGVFYCQKKQFDQARREFETALTISPSFNEAKIWLDKINPP